MKYASFSILMLFAITSCEKEQIKPTYSTGTTGTATMTVGGRKISFPTKGINLRDGKYDLSFWNYILNQQSSLGISFSRLNLNLDRQQVGIYSDVRPYSYMYTNGGDVTRDEYLLDNEDTTENYLQFTEINKEQGKLKGIFRGIYAIDISRNYLYFDLPDTVIITDGAFDLRTKL